MSKFVNTNAIAGAIGIGFSKPMVALYNASGNTVTYTGGIPFARGVSVQIQPNSSDDNAWRADNMDAESAGGRFTGGSMTVVTDDLFYAADQLIHGRGETAEVNGIEVEKSTVVDEVPYCGFGYLRKYQCGGAEIYRAIMLTKVKFNESGDNAETEEETKNWQTTENSAQLFRDDSADKSWRLRGANYYTTEDEAFAELCALLMISSSSGSGTSGSGTSGSGT